MIDAVLDASALLAVLNSEPGSGIVEETLPGAAISAVNLSEVISKLAERGMPEPAIRAALEGVGLEVHAFDVDAAYSTARLRKATKPYGLSLGDRTCLALGLALKAPILTADRTWKKIKLGVKIRSIR